MEFTGKIIEVGELKSGTSQKTGNTWMTQDYVIEETVSNYPRKMCFSVWGEDKIKRMGIAVGQQLVVSFDIDARKFNNKWYNELRAWKVDSAEVAQPQAGLNAGVEVSQSAQLSEAQKQQVIAAKQALEAGGMQTDELPF